MTYIHARKDTLGIAKFRSWCGCIITAPNSTADVERVTCGKCWQKLKGKMRRRAAEIRVVGKASPKNMPRQVRTAGALKRLMVRNAVSDIARSISKYDDATPAKKAALTRLRKRASAEWRAGKRA